MAGAKSICPPLLLPAKDRRASITSSSVAHILAASVTGSGGTKSLGTGGCFMWSAVKTSDVISRTGTSETTTLTVASGYPTLRPQATTSKVVEIPKGPYGVPDAMLHGLHAGRASAGLQPSHPLEASEAQWLDHQFRMDCVMLKNSQGMHAPLKLHMERHVASKAQRLPCLPSSNLMMDTLTGRDELIGFEDFLNNPADSEVMGQPHVMMERQLGLS